MVKIHKYNYGHKAFREQNPDRSAKEYPSSNKKVTYEMSDYFKEKERKQRKSNET